VSRRNRRIKIERLEPRALLTVDVMAAVGEQAIGHFAGTRHGTIFAAHTSTSGTELWRTDGTAAGTVLVKDLTSGAASTRFGPFAQVGPRAFFVVDDRTAGADAAAQQVWVSDGTAKGTRRLVTFAGVAAAGAPRQFVGFGGDTYFAVGAQMWRSDGTAAGTGRVFASQLAAKKKLVTSRKSPPRADGSSSWPTPARKATA
jgi:ELWxxDGT repeat protein